MRWMTVALEARVNGAEPKVHGTLDGRVTACGKHRPAGDVTRWRGMPGRVTCVKCARCMVGFARATLALVDREPTEPYEPRNGGRDDRNDAGE